MSSQILQIFLIIFVPLGATWLVRNYKIASFLSPIVICFGVGILLRNLSLIPIDEGITGIFRDVSILIALPLLLFSSDVRSWLRHSSKTILSFGYAVASGALASVIAAYIFGQAIHQVWVPAGMMVGIHTGGTPNLFVVGMALEAKEEVITLTNSAQILWGAIYLLFLLSLAPRLIGFILKDFQKSKSNPGDTTVTYLRYHKMAIPDIAIGILVTVLIIGLSVGCSFLIYGTLRPTFVVVIVTTFAIICSFSEYIRSLQGPFEVGDFCLLMFGAAVGMMSDFKILIEEGGPYILFVCFILIVTVAMHITLCRLSHVDRDTFIITSTAAIFGPVFIPQVAQALQNRTLIVGGIAASLAGLAMGNYIGLSVAYMIKALLT